MRRSATWTAGIYLLALRGEHAKRMLRQDRPIAEVAYACGFAHPAHRTNMFRRFTSLTRANYRREARIGAHDPHRGVHPLTQTHREMQ